MKQIVEDTMMIWLPTKRKNICSMNILNIKKNLHVLPFHDFGGPGVHTRGRRTGMSRVSFAVGPDTLFIIFVAKKTS